TTNVGNITELKWLWLLMVSGGFVKLLESCSSLLVVGENTNNGGVVVLCKLLVKTPTTGLVGSKFVVSPFCWCFHQQTSKLAIQNTPYNVLENQILCLHFRKT